MWSRPVPTVELPLQSRLFCSVLRKHPSRASILLRNNWLLQPPEDVFEVAVGSRERTPRRFSSGISGAVDLPVAHRDWVSPPNDPFLASRS
ncbi:hypothetical protein QR680_005315 [Steinernema hermaphroditum]|uniref:Uncharacterized protein n=1 Tax=Steinernema hermaphroditum TaxID=289476 RepID=A0AA39LV44_9BILA|nr:hypothetical protein QR680_005315 [Steinernema hermaphroditum]